MAATAASSICAGRHLTGHARRSATFASSSQDRSLSSTSLRQWERHTLSLEAHEFNVAKSQLKGRHRGFAKWADAGNGDSGARRFPAPASASASFAAGDAAFAPDPATQERVSRASSVLDNVRAVAFYLMTLLIAIPLFVVMVAIHPFVLLFDKLRRRGQHFVNNIWANTTTSLFYKTDIVGAENLPEPDAAAVYVANHQSQLDIYTLFQLRRPFKFISKTSNFLIPIVGWSMFLTGHVPLARADKRSQMECLKQCLSLLQAGVPVLFFPEGTRTKDGSMGSFKKGAFSIAAKAGVPVVPITLLGTGTLMPNGQEGTLFGRDALDEAFGVGSVRVVVHPPIVSKDADELCNKSREIIAKTLKENGLAVQ